MIKILEKIIDLIFPQICGICGKLDKKSLCKKCELVLQKNAEFKIEKNLLDQKYFKNHLYIFQYQGIIRTLILNYKFNDKAHLYKTFMKFILKNEKFFKKLKSYDTIIPVPISKKRLKERGYNQSELIAKEMAFALNISYDSKNLIKIKDILEQSKLNKEQRLLNIQGAYFVNDYDSVKNKRILLVDDVYTTGSTVSECAKVLCEGCRFVDVFTLAKG